MHLLGERVIPIPRRNLYIREDDESIWKRAESLAGEESLSATVTEALRRFVLAKEQEAGISPYQRIELSVAITDQEDSVSVEQRIIGNRIIAFNGRILIDDPDVAVYETTKHKLLFYFKDANGYGSYGVFDSLQEASEARAWEMGADGELMFRGDLIAKVAEALGTPWIEELDI